jgi:hypothetical protein
VLRWALITPNYPHPRQDSFAVEQQRQAGGVDEGQGHEHARAIRSSASARHQFDEWQAVAQADELEYSPHRRRALEEQQLPSCGVRVRDASSAAKTATTVPWVERGRKAGRSDF